jgi:hypothetical protein
MPFEGDVADFTIAPPVIETPAQRTIRKAREMLDERARWTRTWQDGEAFCILGALRHAHHGDAHQPGTGGAQDYVMRVLRRRGYTGITTFNDHHAAHVQVLAVLDAAYELAGKPKGFKLDLKRVPPKGWRGARDLLTGEPLPPPVHCSSLRPTVAEVIEHVIPAQRADWANRFPDKVARPVSPRQRALNRAIDAQLLAAARFALRSVV